MIDCTSASPTPPAPTTPRMAEARMLISNRYSQKATISGMTWGSTPQRCTWAGTPPAALAASTGPGSIPSTTSAVSLPRVPMEWMPMASVPA